VRDMSFGLDANFTEPAIAERINSDLANDLGNLLNRTLGMLGRYRDGVVPAAGPLEPIDEALKDAFLALPDTFARQFEALQFDRAIEGVMEAVRKANKYIADTTPWELAKDEAAAGRLDTVLHTLVEALRCASILLDPVVPAKAHELRKQLGIKNAPYDLASASEWGLIPPGTQTQPGEPLFPRIDLEALAQQIEDEARAAEEAALAAERAAAEPEPLEHKPEITIHDFAKSELRVVTVEAAEQHPNADKLLLLTVRMGPETRTVVSGIKPHYEPDDLIGKKLVLVTNLQPVTIRGVESQGMILAAEDDDGQLSLVTLDRDLADASEVH
jgi:methionyl-tRNA synthetase